MDITDVNVERIVFMSVMFESKQTPFEMNQNSWVLHLYAIDATSS